MLFAAVGYPSPMASHRVGVQSVVFAERELSDLLDDLGETQIDALELWGEHLSPHDHAATVAASVAALKATMVDVCGYGVVELNDPAEVDDHAAFADRLDAEYMTVSYPPMDDEITQALVDAAEAYDVDVALHNTSGVHHDDTSGVFSSLAEVKDVLERTEHPRLGACVDTGHFLIAEEDPAEAIEDLGERIVAVHCKDTTEEEVEDLPGAGELDLPGIVDLLDEHGAADVPLIIEYELDAAEVLPALQDAEANLRAAIAR